MWNIYIWCSFATNHYETNNYLFNFKFTITTNMLWYYIRYESMSKKIFIMLWHWTWKRNDEWYDRGPKMSRLKTKSYRKATTPTTTTTTTTTTKITKTTTSISCRCRRCSWVRLVYVEKKQWRHYMIGPTRFICYVVVGWPRRILSTTYALYIYVII